MPTKKTITSKPINKNKHEYSFVSYSSSSILTPTQKFHKELVFQNNSGKVSGKYLEEQNGKKIVNKEFKSQKGFDALQKRIDKQIPNKKKKN
jgi:hypothetical protein